MSALTDLRQRVRPLAERLDGLAVRERALLFLGGAIVICLAWQSLLMEPLSARARVARERLTETSQSMRALEQSGAAAVGDPLVAAAGRNQALSGRLAQLDGELKTLAQGYVPPERVAELLQEILADQHGLRLIRLANLPVQSLSQPASAVSAANASNAATAAGAETVSPVPADDRGPFLHPVEIIVEGDYGSIVAYLHALEALPWRIHWQQLELSPGPDAVNHVRIVIGALSLSRNWMSV